MPALIPTSVLIAALPFSGRLSAARASASLAEGLAQGGRPDHELVELPAQASELPPDMEARMRRSHAIVIAVPRLERAELRGSVGFELATTARQAGVPAYAVTAHNELDAFDARLLDLQVIIEARTPAALRAAGARLGELM